MMDRQTVWVDVARCTGCGACVEVCPVEAIALVDDKARVDEETCTGCQACVDVCPENAIQPVIQGELIPVPERPASTVYQPSPLAETAGAAVVVAGAGLLAKAAGALARSVGRWLTRPSTGARPPAARASSTAGSRTAAGRGARRGGGGEEVGEMGRGRGDGRGAGTGRGRGQRPGRMGGSKAAGPGGSCVCPNCGHKVPHVVGQPCYQRQCPKCGAQMTR